MSDKVEWLKKRLPKRAKSEPKEESPSKIIRVTPQQYIDSQPLSQQQVLKKLLDSVEDKIDVYTVAPEPKHNVPPIKVKMERGDKR